MKEYMQTGDASVTGLEVSGGGSQGGMAVPARQVIPHFIPDPGAIWRGLAADE